MAGGDSTVTSRKDGVMTSVAVKAPCACASTAPLTLAGFQTVGGVVLTATVPLTRVLVKDQTDKTQNGIYDVVSGTWPRSVDFDGAYDAVQGTLVYVFPPPGSAEFGTIYRCTTPNPIVFGTSQITFAPNSNTVPSFGIVNDGFVSGIERTFLGTDNAAALQAFIDSNIYLIQSASRLPSGKFRTTAMVQVNYGDSYRSPSLVGDGVNYGDIPGGTAIISDQTNAGGINVQGGRSVLIEKLGLFGRNWHWLESNNFANVTPTSSLDDTVRSNWYDPVLANPESPNAPYAAIVIDAYAGTKPSPAYPDLTFPPYTGIVTQYGKNHTSAVALRDFSLWGWGTCVAIEPNADGNGDFIDVTNFNVNYSAILFSAGNTQGRALQIRGGAFAVFHTGFANGIIGVQEGDMQINAMGVSFGNCIQLLDIPSATFAGPATFEACYGEALWRLGNWGSGGSATEPLQFINCQWSFDNQLDARGFPAECLSSGGQTPITFNGGSMSYPTVLLFGGAVNLYKFENMLMQPNRPIAQPYFYLAMNALAGGIMFTPTTNYPYPTEFSVRSPDLYNIDSGGPSDITHQSVNNPYPSQRSYPIPLWCSKARAALGQGTWRTVEVPVRWTPYPKSALSSLTRTGRTLTITFDGSYTAAQFLQYGPSNGDVVYDDLDKSVYFVTDVTGQVVTAALQQNYRFAASTYTYFNAFSASVGGLWFGVSRVYSPQYVTRGVATNGSAVVTMIGRADTFGGYIGVANGDIQAGDALWVDSETDTLFAVGTKVNSVTPGSPASMVMSAVAAVAGLRGITTGTTHTNTTLDSLAVDVHTIGWRVGAIITGADIPANTWIASIASNGLSVTLSAAATGGHAGGTYTVDASASIPLTFFVRFPPANL